MEVRCSLCGKKEELPEWHRDYDKAEKGLKFTYICLVCTSRLKNEAQDGQKPRKPI